MSEETSNPIVMPNKLPLMTHDQVMERAQKIFEHRGTPPFNRAEHFSTADDKHFVTDEEMAVISDFVFHWLPYLTVKPK